MATGPVPAPARPTDQTGRLFAARGSVVDVRFLIHLHLPPLRQRLRSESPSPNLNGSEWS